MNRQPTMHDKAMRALKTIHFIKSSKVITVANVINVFHSRPMTMFKYLEKHGYVTISTVHKKQYVELTEKGIEFLKAS